ncbi:hypothetical protein Tsp_11060 [Trichinella spiralis]|uniref:hypothetical protein n=1 Tax=Trichinella spiralis TaxID=6334 RepID=UPI0001EFB9A4|nr:hypothetical protein Tsp_11060 [Trichinella spiralis]
MFCCERNLRTTSSSVTVKCFSICIRSNSDYPPAIARTIESEPTKLSTQIGRENIATKTQRSFKETPTDHADLSKTTGQFTIRQSCTLCLKRKVDAQIRPDDCGILIESSSVSKSRDSSPPYQTFSQQVGSCS